MLNIACKKSHRKDYKHAASCKHGPKYELNHNEKSDETALTQIQDLKNAVKELHEKNIASLEKTIEQNYSKNVEILKKNIKCVKRIDSIKKCIQRDGSRKTPAREEDCQP